MTSFAKKIGTLAMLSLVLSMGVYGGLWYEVYRGEEKVREGMAQQAKEAEEQRQFVALEKEYLDSEKDRQMLQNFVVGKEGATDFLELVESTGRAQGLNVEIKSAQDKEMKESATFEQLVISLEVSGPYKSIVSFLPLIESLPYQTEIASVSLEQVGGEGEWRGLFDLRVVKEKSS